VVVPMLELAVPALPMMSPEPELAKPVRSIRMLVCHRPPACVTVEAKIVPVPVVMPVPAVGPALPARSVTPVTPRVPPTEAFVPYVELVVTAPIAETVMRYPLNRLRQLHPEFRLQRRLYHTWNWLFQRLLRKQ